MHINKYLSLLLIGCFLSGNAFGKDFQVSLKCVDITPIKLSEKSGDEIYFSIIHYSSLGRSQESRVPDKPLAWLSADLVKVKNVILWDGKIEEGESQKIIVALTEKDLPPWDPDDSVGSAELSIENDHGKLKREWKIPVYEETEEVEMVKNKPTDPVQIFIFKGNDSYYKVTFSMEQKVIE